MRQDLKDQHGRLIGFITVNGNRKEIHDSHGAFLGFYNGSGTYDQHGRYIGSGDLLTMLLNK